MSIYYLPKERCTIEQALKNAELWGMNVNDKEAKEGKYWVEDFGSSAMVCVEDGWVRRGARYGANDNDTVDLILTQVANCEWVDEHDEAYFAYANWNKKERLESAKEVVEDVIESAEFDGYLLTEQEAIKDELHSELSLRKQFDVPDTLPLAAPVTEFELYAPKKPVRIEAALQNAQEAGLYTDFHKSGKIDFSFGPLTDEQGPVTGTPWVTAVVDDGYIKDAAVYLGSADNSDATLEAITKCEWV